MVSKELLLEIDKDLVEWKLDRVTENGNYLIIEYLYDTKEDGTKVWSQYKDINIHEIISMCKEWLVSKGYVFIVQNTLGIVTIQIYKDNLSIYRTVSSSLLAEYKVIVKACEYLLIHKQGVQN